ncbi:hypothetical protein HPB50_015539 [Hyalomma asiaticum]|uniref:Uncharacterized protein n=1 Tax=Hyalomma asiaticum TaxID=266040 RepID=A0ACB7RVD3_HYAAI|nr:hypothetical protein HPB50_015539 [Hyalomma asiaticum]
MLGRSALAVITFQGPHVPLYVKVANSFARCRPYRRSVEYCKVFVTLAVAVPKEIKATVREQADQQ